MPLYNLWGEDDISIEISKDTFPNEAWLRDQDELFQHPKHGWFESVYKHKKLHLRKNIPSKVKVKAVVVWHHGISGQSGFGMQMENMQYTDQALRIRQFCDEGIAVYSYDALGHGFSEGTRFYIPNGNWEIYRDDLVAFCKMAAKDFDETIPILVSGDSFGGCLALHAAHYFQENAAERPANFIGCTLNCPSIHADLPPKPIEFFLSHCLAPCFPEWTPLFMPNPITSERIWREEEARAYFSNPDNMHDLAHGGAPFCLGTALGLLSALKEAQKISYTFTLPFHITHGDKDYGVPISGSQHLYENSQTPPDKKSLNVVVDGYHGLFPNQTLMRC